MTDDADLRAIAVRRANMKLAFRAHLMTYVVVNAGLIAINLVTSPGYFWAIWPMIGWGIGIVAHGLNVYMDGENMRDRLIEEELEKLRARR